MIRYVKACGVDFAQWRAIVVCESREAGIAFGTFNSPNLAISIGNGGFEHKAAYGSGGCGRYDHRRLRHVANTIDEYPTRALPTSRRNHFE